MGRDSIIRQLVVTFASATFLAGSNLAPRAQAAQSQPAGYASQQGAGDKGIAAGSALGDVIALDAAGKQLTIQTRAGDVTVHLGESTRLLRVRPGERTLENAETITLPDVGIGDRVLARGNVGEDGKSVSARQLVVISKAMIAQKQERDREEWSKRGIAGAISTINAVKKEVTLQMRSSEGNKPLVIIVGDAEARITFRRYPPDSAKLADARRSSFAELKVGDQFWALGNKSADGTRFDPEEILSGSFVTVGGRITAINPTAGEIQINNIPTQKPLTVVINKNSMLRRIPPQLVAMLAGKTQPAGVKPAPARSDAPRQPGGARSDIAPKEAKVGGEKPQASGGDVHQLLERLPAITLADLKPGEMILVSSSIGTDPARVTAIVLAAGVEPLLTRPPGAQGTIPDAKLGLPGDVLDFAIGPPPN